MSPISPRRFRAQSGCPSFRGPFSRMCAEKARCDTAVALRSSRFRDAPKLSFAVRGKCPTDHKHAMVPMSTDPSIVPWRPLDQEHRRYIGPKTGASTTRRRNRSNGRAVNGFAFFLWRLLLSGDGSISRRNNCAVREESPCVN